jgi:hypothetical protein
MVFHRFLTGEVRGKRFKLLLNGNEIKPWDPFCRSEAKSKKLQTIAIPVEHEGVSGEVLFEPFVLPHQDDFSSVEAFRQASGPANWNQQQGFYIYRAGRMIQSGGWSNLRTSDEHTKLARVAVSFSPALDEAFKINVAKMRVQMPSLIREEVRAAIVPVAKLARENYDRKSGRTQNPSLRPLESPSPQTSSSNTPAGTTSHPPLPATTVASQNTSLLTLEEWSERLLKVATQQERPVVEAVLERLGC